jgi:type IV pilus assembly protein PilB
MANDDKDFQHKIQKIRREAEERDAERRAEKLGAPYIDLRKVPVALEALRLVHEDDARKAIVAVVEIKSHNVAVAAYDPSSVDAQRVIAGLKDRRYIVKVFSASRSGIDEAWKLYRFAGGDSAEITGKFEITKVEQLIGTLKNTQGVAAEVERRDVQKLTTTELFQIVLAGGLATRASDLHFEAEEHGSKIRYRLDGALYDVITNIPQRTYDALISRIKLLSGLKINIHSEPQDGRFTIGLSTKEVEVRVSIIPSEFGETVVMRLLDPDSINVDLSHLGLRPDDLVVAERAIQRPNGLILNTGPTGSGKTTTLYAFLRRIVNPEIKIITVEDPIEYRVSGVEQTQTNPEAGYTFAGGLRAILRQDPDVILVGEVRDKETADIALQAALTGHLVFSTLHTNDAAGAVPRLVDLGVRPMTIGPALALAIAQRLVRRLCTACRVAEKPSPELAQKLKKFIDGLPARVDRAAYKDIAIYSKKGCEECSNVGYRGRIAIYEFLETGPEFEEAIIKGLSTGEIREIARKQRMVTLQEDGVLKVISGITSFAEVESITGEIPWMHAPT